jgi:hypothetical protein
VTHKHNTLELEYLGGPYCGTEISFIASSVHTSIGKQRLDREIKFPFRKRIFKSLTQNCCFLLKKGLREGFAN